LGATWYQDAPAARRWVIWKQPPFGLTHFDLTIPGGSGAAVTRRWEKFPGPGVFPNAPTGEASCRRIFGNPGSCGILIPDGPGASGPFPPRPLPGTLLSSRPRYASCSYIGATDSGDPNVWMRNRKRRQRSARKENDHECLQDRNGRKSCPSRGTRSHGTSLPWTPMVPPCTDRSGPGGMSVLSRKQTGTGFLQPAPTLPSLF